jgi:hypothetical protein
MTKTEIAELVLRSILVGVSFGGNELGGWEGQYYDGSGGDVAELAASMCGVKDKAALRSVGAIGRDFEEYLVDDTDEDDMPDTGVPVYVRHVVEEIAKHMP